MSVALRTITRLQDADDINVSLGAGVDEYALTYDHDTAKFVLRAPAAAPDLSGYALLAGRAGGQTLYGGTAANEDITIHGTSDGTRTTSYVLLQPTAGNVGIGTSAPLAPLDVAWDGQGGKSSILIGANDGAGTSVRTNAVDKVSSLGIVHRLSAEEPVCLILGVSTASANSVIFGGGTSGLNAATDIYFYTGSTVTTTLGVSRMRITSAGLVGIGTTAPAALLHGLLTSAATNAVTNVVTIGHDTSGTAAAGFGAGLLYQLESSTTAAQSAARIQALWYEATHATRKADLVLTAYDTSEREGLRIRGAGSAPAIGFYGVSPIERATLATGAGASVDDVITALQNLGLVKQS